jgi:hypothetical protein
MPTKSKLVKRKNAAASAFGRIGASDGGKARAKSLSPERRREIAHKASAARMTKISPQRRKEIARKASIARWNKQK